MKYWAKRFSTVLAILTAVVVILNMIDLPVELRFSNAKFNYLYVMVFCILLPLSFFLRSLFCKTIWRKFFGVLFSALLIAPCVLVHSFASSDYNDICERGHDTSFEQINVLTSGKNKYCLYRTNGGATTSFGLILRRETKFLPGMIIVREMFSKYKASESTLELLDSDTIQMKIEPYGKDESVEIVTINI